MYSYLRALLFKLPSERAHDLIMQVARLSPALGELTGSQHDPRLKIKVGKTVWNFPIGLAAGMDKNADALDFFEAQGFGCVECGTVTLRPQAGNPKPRMFRYSEDQSLRNSMGFPNQGLEAILPRLRMHSSGTPVGVNIGKNKDSSALDSIAELCFLFEALEEVADYFVINVSSPNTPGLRELQEKAYLTELFKELNLKRGINGRDLYLKISPDLPAEKVRELAKLAQDHNLTGVIATNTTIIPSHGAGGVSGILLREKSRQVRKILLEEKLKIEVIGVGGFTEPDDLFDFWHDGGKVAQVYSAYVFQGPDFLKKMKAAIIDFLDHEKIYSLQEFFSFPLEERRRHLSNYRSC